MSKPLKDEHDYDILFPKKARVKLMKKSKLELLQLIDELITINKLEKEIKKGQLDWMMNTHEERIEELIKYVEQHVEDTHWDGWDLFIVQIEQEYESIMILQKGLEDVL